MAKLRPSVIEQKWNQEELEKELGVALPPTSSPLPTSLAQTMQIAQEELKGAAEPSRHQVQLCDELVREGRTVAASSRAAQAESGSEAEPGRHQLQSCDEHVREQRAVATSTSAAQPDMRGEADPDRHQVQRCDEHM